jgi:hypothetical protein
MGGFMKRVVTAIISALGIAAAQASPPTPSEPTGRDYSHVTSREAAEQLATKGELFKILLFPEEFGGQDVPVNVAYVPAGVPEVKDQLTDTLIRFYQEGLIDKLTITPEYKGNSFVPSRIVVRATHSSKDGVFEPTIDVW